MAGEVWRASSQTLKLEIEVGIRHGLLQLFPWLLLDFGKHLVLIPVLPLYVLFSSMK